MTDPSGLEVMPPWLPPRPTTFERTVLSRHGDVERRVTPAPRLLDDKTTEATPVKIPVRLTLAARSRGCRWPPGVRGVAAPVTSPHAERRIADHGREIPVLLGTWCDPTRRTLET